MGNCAIGYPNRANGATITGGSWLPALPASNLATRALAQVARSTDALAASTKFNVDFGVARSIRAVGLHNHNSSVNATWRIKLGSSSGASDVYDSGTMLVWRIAFDDLVEWESVAWWTGVSGDEYLRSPYAAMALLSDTYSARYLTIEISDTGNADGYWQCGRLFAGNAIRTAYNPAAGLQDSWRDLSEIQSSQSGALLPTVGRRIRQMRCEFPYVTTTETQYVHEMQRMVGTVDEVLWMPYPDDPGENQRYGFLGRFMDLGALTYAYFRARSVPMQLEEMA